MSTAIDATDELAPPTSSTSPEALEAPEVGGEGIDLDELNQAIRVIMAAVADRIPSAVSITEREVLFLGRCVSEVIEAARSQVAESRDVADHVSENSSMATAWIDELSREMASVLEELSPGYERRRSVLAAAAAGSAKIELARNKIESVALVAKRLDRDARLEIAGDGAACEPLVAIASGMTSLIAELEEARQLVSDLGAELCSKLSEVVRLGEENSRLCAASLHDFESRLAEVRDAQGAMQETLRDSLRSTEQRTELMLRIGQQALSHLQFQDPVAQSLRQVQRGMAAVGAMVKSHAAAFEDSDAGHADTSDGHNPLHALAAQYGLAGHAKTHARIEGTSVVEDDDDQALDPGEVLLF